MGEQEIGDAAPASSPVSRFVMRWMAVHSSRTHFIGGSVLQQARERCGDGIYYKMNKINMNIQHEFENNFAFP